MILSLRSLTPEDLEVLARSKAQPGVFHGETLAALSECAFAVVGDSELLAAFGVFRLPHPEERLGIVWMRTTPAVAKARFALRSVHDILAAVVWEDFDRIISWVHADYPEGLRTALFIGFELTEPYLLGGEPHYGISLKAYGPVDDSGSGGGRRRERRLAGISTKAGGAAPA